MRTRLRRVGHETFRSLRTRNFRLFFYGQLISQTGTWLTMIAQTLLVLKLTDNSGIAVGLLTACQFGPVLLLGAWAGAVADRADKRRLLMILQTLAMMQSYALATVVFTHNATVPVIYALAAFQGVLTAFDNPTRRSFVVEMVPDDQLNNAVSLNSAIMTGSRVVGPAAAGALVISVGFGWCFLLDGLSYLAVLWSLWRMRPSELYSASRTRRAKGQVREGLRYIRSHDYLFVPLVMMALIGTLAFNFSVTIPLLISGPLHGSDATFTLMYSVLGIGSVTGALYTARRRTVTGKHLVASSFGFGIAMLALAAAPTMPFAFVAAVGVGLASITFMTSSTAIVQMLAGPRYRGRVLAIQSMVFLGSTPIGGPLIGFVCDATGPRVGIVIGAVACLVAAVYGTKALGLRRPPEAPEGDELLEVPEPAMAD
jgi:MFS family permease